jgi:hypothetical protein
LDETNVTRLCCQRMFISQTSSSLNERGYNNVVIDLGDGTFINKLSEVTSTVSCD